MDSLERLGMFQDITGKQTKG